MSSALLARYIPPAGPCALCGHPDKRHRMVDALAGRVAAGETVRAIARDLDIPPAAVRLACEIKATERRGHRRWSGYLAAGPEGER